MSEKMKITDERERQKNKQNKKKQNKQRQKERCKGVAQAIVKVWGLNGFFARLS